MLSMFKQKLISTINKLKFIIGLNKSDKELIKQIKFDKLTYLSKAKMANIALAIKKLNRSKTPGIFIEAGCALGGSTILISKMKNRQRPLQVYDVFGMIPPPSEMDPKEVHVRYQQIRKGLSKGIGDEVYYGYVDELKTVVQQNLHEYSIELKENNISLIEGLVQDTMHINFDVAFVHIDVDWYEPVKACLERVSPYLASGGYIILDDYYDWGGCKKAVDEFISANPDQFTLDGSFGAMNIIKI